MSKPRWSKLGVTRYELRTETFVVRLIADAQKWDCDCTCIPGVMTIPAMNGKRVAPKVAQRLAMRLIAARLCWVIRSWRKELRDLTKLVSSIDFIPEEKRFISAG